MNKIILENNRLSEISFLRKWLETNCSDKIFDLIIENDDFVFLKKILSAIFKKGFAIKSIVLNFSLSKKTTGRCFLRFLKRIHRTAIPLLITYTGDSLTKLLLQKLNDSLLPIVIKTKGKVSLRSWRNLEILNSEADKLYFDFVAWKNHSHFVSCEHSSCLGKTICLSRGKKIKICKKCDTLTSAGAKIEFESIFNEDFYYNLLENSVEKRMKCKSECPYFNFCKSGCPLRLNECFKDDICALENKYNSIKEPSVACQEMKLLNEIIN